MDAVGAMRQGPLPLEDALVLEPVAAGAGMRALFAAFDTMVELTAFGKPAAMEAALLEARDACRAYEQLFSRTLPGSDIGRLNRAGGQAVRIDPRTADLLLAALRYCKASGGAFDITVGPLVGLWDLKAGRIPGRDELGAAAAHVGWEGLAVWAQCGGSWFARLSDPAAQVDLGGIAKGWIADALGRQLSGAGATGALVNLGGNVLVRGAKPSGAPWRVGIREPRCSADSPGTLAVVDLACGSMVTSGIYERCFEQGGVRYHHILDPSTGWPVDTPWAGVSVVAERSIDAEGFSTTLLALGLERERALAAAHPEILQAYFVDWEGGITPLR